MKDTYKLMGIIAIMVFCSIAIGGCASSPSSSCWVDAADLPSLRLWDLQNNTIGSFIEMHFGTHTWLTAGYDETTGGMVLLCSPRDSYGEMEFDSDTQSNYASIYENCDLRAYLVGEALDEFSDKEKQLMLSTKGEYLPSSGDKLYLPNGEDGAFYFTVGASDDVLVSIRNGSFSAAKNRIWLRAPYSGSKALAVIPGYYVTSTTTDVYNKYLVCPAFCLDIESILFASAAQPAISSQSFSPSRIMTLRLQNDGRIQGQALYKTDTILIRGSMEDAYLYIQWSEGINDCVYSVKAEDNMIIHASDIQDNLDFSTCKIWLEVFDDDENLVYAKMASEYISVERVSLSESVLHLPVGVSHELIATIEPSNASVQEIKWESENEEVITVNQGLVTILAPGSTTVKVTAADDQTALCEITSLHTVKWMDGDYTIKTDMVTFGSTLSFDGSLPTRDDSVFMYWETNGSEYDESSLVVCDTTIFAKWFKRNGYCGLNVNYVLDENGVLVISGQGAINSACFTNNGYIKSVVINDGVTILSDAAFQNCSNLCSILLPGNLTIGKNVFQGTGLSRVVFAGDAPMGVTNHTFLPITKFYASYKAKGFDVLPWTAFEIQYSHPYSLLFENHGILTLPETLTKVEAYAFCKNDSIIAVILPERIGSIGEKAFAECPKLYGIRMPKDSVLTIDESAFSNSENIVIYGLAGSKWEEYAHYHVLPFESIDN